MAPFRLTSRLLTATLALAAACGPLPAAPRPPPDAGTTAAPPPLTEPGPPGGDAGLTGDAGTPAPREDAGSPVGPGDGGPPTAGGVEADAGSAAQPGEPDPADAGAGPQGAQDAGAPPSAPDGGWLVPALTSCPSLPACGPRAAVPGTFASYRKDAFLPDSEYAEQGLPPLTGGRLHVAGVASASGTVTRVRINGTPVDDLLAQAAIDWYHVWPRDLVAGEPVWVAFHSRSASWDSAQTATVSVEASGGTLFSGTFPVARAPVPLRYVTTADDGAVLLVHAVNADTVPHTLARLVVDGRDVTAASCLPRRTLAPGEHALLRVPQCTPKRPGEPWTVVLELTDGAAAVGVGRVVPEFFPIEAWVKTAECPFPGGSATNLARHQAAGIDTHFTRFGSTGCGLTGERLVNGGLAPLQGRLRALLTDDFLDQPNPGAALTDTRFIAGFFTGDESDTGFLTNGFPTPELKARKSRALWRLYPSVPTYNGGMTNKKIGAFAGMADVQGMDFYVAACAPHVTVAGTRMPIRGAYDYLRNARANHAPLPTWLYAQGLHDGWNKSVLGTVVRVQPDPAELRAQALSVAAAGGKGLMWFQSELAEADLAPASWDALRGSSWALRAVRAWLREGDPAGLASAAAATPSSPLPIVEAIRARDALVVTVLSQHVTAEPSDLSCGAIYTLGPVPHFAFGAQTVEVRVRLPDDLQASELFEVTTSASPAVVDGPPPVVVGRELRFPVALGQTTPARLFVIAAGPGARQTAAAALAP